MRQIDLVQAKEMPNLMGLKVLDHIKSCCYGSKCSMKDYRVICQLYSDLKNTVQVIFYEEDKYCQMKIPCKRTGETDSWAVANPNIPFTVFTVSCKVCVCMLPSTLHMST